MNYFLQMLFSLATSIRFGLNQVAKREECINDFINGDNEFGRED
jgi:hypothetical protein